MRATRAVNGLGRSRRTGALAVALFVLAGFGLAGLSCAKKPVASEPRTPRDVQVPPYLKDTVGELARVSGREEIPVQGLGFVTGLDGTGNKVIPPGIRQQALDMMRRNHVEHAEEILAIPDNAVVLVTGLLPPAVAKGELFDLEVRAVATTDTTSLEGGFLLEGDLARIVSERGVEAKGEILALGRGAVFVSPFSPDDKSRAGADPRLGRILAGGKAFVARYFRLALLVPSVRTADQIVRLVNARFPGAAKGTEDPGNINLSVPKEYQNDKTRFLDLVGAIYLRETPDARDQRVALLLGTLQNGRDMDRVALGLEAFGGSVAPALHALANHSSEAVRFYAGRTLAGLQDAQAVHILEPIALDDRSEFQEMAVEALGELRNGLGLGVLGRALEAKSVRVRIAAWQNTARLAPRTFVARTFADKFTLSIIATKADPFIYVARTMKPELAIFGDLTVRPPVLAETRRLTATAQAGAKEITVFTRRKNTDLRVEAPLDVRGLIEKLAAPFGLDRNPEPQGLDASYSDIVGLLNEMARKHALSGPIVLQPIRYRVPGGRPTARPIGEPEETINLQPEEKPAAKPKPKS